MPEDDADAGAIAPHELLYRKVRVSAGWWNPAAGRLSPKAVRPDKRDVDGLSVDRARSDRHPDFRTARQAGAGPQADGYYVAVFRVSDLIDAGLTVVADPLTAADPGGPNPGHALIPELNAEDRRSERVAELIRVLTNELLLRVEGPFISVEG